MECPNCGNKAYSILKIAKKIDRKTFECNDCKSHLQFNYKSGKFILKVIGTTLLVGTVSGLLVAFFSRFNPNMDFAGRIFGIIVTAVIILICNLFVELKVVGRSTQ